jgi:Xaa-Pro dipeptidase
VSAARAARRAALLEHADGRPVVLSFAPDVAWYTGGFDVRIDRHQTAGSTVVVVSAEGEWVVTDAIEAPRLAAEEPTLADLELVVHPWPSSADDTVRDLVGPGAVTDLDLQPLRMVLDEETIARYRVLGADTRAALDEATAGLTAATTELEVAGRLAEAAWRRDAHTPVLLVAGAERIERFRHPLPTTAPIGARAMVVTCVERGGLYACVTRFVHLDGTAPVPELAVTDELLRRMREEATVEGATIGEAFDACRRFYAEAGFADEWQRHHQGGVTGYRSREVLAGPGDPTVIRPGMAFAWNPSVTGAKSEETFVLLEGGVREVLA